MARRSVAVVALLAICLGSAMCNDVPLRFAVFDCDDQPVVDATVTLTGCVDYPMTCTTDDDGLCWIDDAPNVIQYCYGSARSLCMWSLSTADGIVYTPNHHTMMMNTVPVTPFEFSKCKCDGSDYCEPVIPYPTRIVFKPSTCRCPTSPLPVLGGDVITTQPLTNRRLAKI